MTDFIDNPNHYRISKSGYSIKTGWATESRIVAKYPGNPTDMLAFNQWMEDAERICDLHNATIDSAMEEQGHG